MILLIERTVEVFVVLLVVAEVRSAKHKVGRKGSDTFSDL